MKNIFFAVLSVCLLALAVHAADEPVRASRSVTADLARVINQVQTTHAST
ncbi:MAG: hypothetical protein HY923_07405 [Elusimicrobia bacterium]|nr:hypothetical protein [Elusimicrobiota bacterium]